MHPFYMVSLADTLSTGLPCSPNEALQKNSLSGLMGWVGIAQLKDIAINAIPLSGSAGCRLLLQKMLATLTVTGTLNECHFPYHIIPPKPSTEEIAYFVSFSHSRTSVAVLLANQPTLGIDIEKRPISTAIAQRYFSSAELAWLGTLPLERQSLARTLLWTLKESRIKSQTDSQLFSGIRHDILAEMGINDVLGLLYTTTNLPARSRLCCPPHPHNAETTKIIENKLIGFDSVQQCGWWINFSKKMPHNTA